MFQTQKKINRMINNLKDRIRRNPKAFRLYSVLRALVIVSLIISLIQGQYESAALCILSLILFLLPAFFEKQLRIEIPPLFEMLIYLFIFSAEILGEVDRFYTAIPGWDTMLHTINGFLCAAIGFSMVDLLNRHSELVDLSPAYVAFAAFCFSMTIGVVWEFIEFFVDSNFFLDMQKDFIIQKISSVTLDPNHSQTPIVVDHITKTVIERADGSTVVVDGGYLDIGLIDTMKDLLVNFVGAITFSLIGYIQIKKRDTDSLAERLKIRVQSEEELEDVKAWLQQREKEREEKSVRSRKKNRNSGNTL